MQRSSDEASEVQPNVPSGCAVSMLLSDADVESHMNGSGLVDTQMLSGPLHFWSSGHDALGPQRYDAETMSGVHAAAPPAAARSTSPRPRIRMSIPSRRA